MFLAFVETLQPYGLVEKHRLHGKRVSLRAVPAHSFVIHLHDLSHEDTGVALYMDCQLVGADYLDVKLRDYFNASYSVVSYIALLRSIVELCLLCSQPQDLDFAVIFK